VPPQLTAAELRGLPLFAQLTDTQADRLLAGQIGLDVVAEQVLLLQRDEGEGLVVIQTGLAKVRAYTANGEEG
jgi:CRP-like cAMP-binding protein